MSLRKFTISVAIVATGIAGGSIAASDYPPDVPPPSTVLTSTGGGSSSTGDDGQGLQRAGTLAATGSDSGNLIKVAGGVVMAGAGLVAVTRRRRHPHAA